MAKFVIKRDGIKEPFDAEKIKRSIIANAQDVNLSEKRINELAKQVSEAVIQLTKEKEEITTTEIKEKILIELDTAESSVSEVWRKFEEERRKV
jgi:transcriptional regulator NrdR family protein